MPNCFQLLRDGVAVPLATIDEEMCLHFGVECHRSRYFNSWFDIIGYDLAKGLTFNEIKTSLASASYDNLSTLVQIAEWLEARFTANAWAEIGRSR